VSGTQFAVWKFQLGILDYLARRSVYFEKFPVRQTIIALPFTVQAIFLVNGKLSIKSTENYPANSLFHAKHTNYAKYQRREQLPGAGRPNFLAKYLKYHF